MIDWGSLGLVAIVSLAAAVVIVSLIALAIVGFSAKEHAVAGTVRGMSPQAGAAVGYACITAVVLITLYGLWLVAGKALTALFT